MDIRKSIVSVLVVAASGAASAADSTHEASHSIAYPTGWQNWSTIGISHRTDNNTLRVILGNEIAVAAARAGQINPWPDGAILGKVVWKDTELANWKAATAPGAFVHAEFMFRDSAKYADTYGWGWARWVGLEQKAFNEGPQVCIACHTPVKDRDWVFTDPAAFPAMVPASE
ncbi:cytochrome P460 family protein [Shewanella sedimentimangrovi]|uniref:Cytochrome P460 family protein n=1 Tax=Shewanella sedimentimangrovi TaxID=2814293 RepID=A0ABX7R3F8_9GAMM|nr:cytochrome P460 family protein [Shewanella sedimentimangrovi]QSX38259.1 cytochrome P460 family protein [Shewanella sedimentimangrovi]